jgi:hypothetical protein
MEVRNGRYLQRATEWDKGGRPANRLLSGDDIAEAKAWVAQQGCSTLYTESVKQQY